MDYGSPDFRHSLRNLPTRKQPLLAHAPASKRRHLRLLSDVAAWNASQPSMDPPSQQVPQLAA
ncbi:hypothetical protein HGRIS_001573 [Hohenbuehelia grisea]|uniref:Uncharacterized protein n=1 Tax=Hohenbuehelia grisea TaxID=104357 RepID=A0ABR3JPW0_9AGAR